MPFGTVARFSAVLGPHYQYKGRKGAARDARGLFFGRHLYVTNTLIDELLDTEVRPDLGYVLCVAEQWR